MTVLRPVAAILLLLLAVTCLPGCYVTSEHPLSDEVTATIDEKLIGEWRYEDDHSDYFGLIKKGDRELVLELVDPNSDESSDLFCTTIGTGRYLSCPVVEEARESYVILRYEFRDDDRVSLEFLDPGKISRAIGAGEIAGVGNRITATSEQLRSFIEKNEKSCFDTKGKLTIRRRIVPQQR